MGEKNKLSRREARELAFKLIFAREFDKNSDCVDFYENYISVTEEKTNTYVHDVFLGVCESVAELDEMIEGASSNWKLSRMSSTTRAILRLAVYEMTKAGTPAKVVINEAVEIIKQYDEESAPSFVNGVLNNIGRAQGYIAEPQTTTTTTVEK